MVHGSKYSTIRKRRQNKFDFSDYLEITKMRYSIESRDRIYLKGYRFLSFAKSMVTYATKVAKNLSNKYVEKRLDSAKRSTTDAIKTASERAIQKTAEAIDDLIGNKIAAKITSVWKKSSSKHSDDEVEVDRVSPKDISPKDIIIEHHIQLIIFRKQK